MATFTLIELEHYQTRQKVYKLCRDGKCYFDDFMTEVKADNNLKPELGDLVPIIKDVANGKKPPTKKYRKENLGKKMPFTVYAAKSAHLRLYSFTDSNGLIIIIGGKKTEQDEDLERSKSIVKEYSEFIKKKK